MIYQNVSNEEGRTKFVNVDVNGLVTDAVFTGKVSNVPLPGGTKVPVVSDQLSLSRNKDVSCPADNCQRSVIGNSVKVSYTVARGDAAAATALIDEAIRLLELWRDSYKADFGLLPPPYANLDTV